MAAAAVATEVASVAVTAAVVAAGAVVADAIVADARKARASAAATCRLPSTLRPKAANLAVTSHAATKIVAAISAALKIAVASLVVLNRVAPRSAALIIARRKLPVPPRPALPRKNPFFFLASLLPSIVANPYLRLRLQWPNRRFTSRNPISKTQLLALPAT
jgi:hypothetical protein